jgi:hypothetical protein
MNDGADELILDGNAAAGPMAQAFGREMTTATRHCDGCGETHRVGGHRVYRGAGWVLRCPGCGDLAAQISEREGGAVLRLSGTWFTTF